MPSQDVCCVFFIDGPHQPMVISPVAFLLLPKSPKCIHLHLTCVNAVASLVTVGIVRDIRGFCFVPTLAKRTAVSTKRSHREIVRTKIIGDVMTAIPRPLGDYQDAFGPNGSKP